MFTKARIQSADNKKRIELKADCGRNRTSVHDPAKIHVHPKTTHAAQNEKKTFANRRGKRISYKTESSESPAKNGTVIPKNKNR